MFHPQKRRVGEENCSVRINMNQRFGTQVWRFIGHSFLLAIVAASIGSVLACLSVGMIRAIPIVALVSVALTLAFRWHRERQYRITEAGVDQPATKPADKSPVKGQP